MSNIELKNALLDSVLGKPSKPSLLNTWKDIVLKRYPSVFFKKLSPKETKILKAIDAMITDAGIDTSKFFEWVAYNWTNLPAITGQKTTYKLPYPEITLVLRNYVALVNCYLISVGSYGSSNRKRV